MPLSISHEISWLQDNVLSPSKLPLILGITEDIRADRELIDAVSRLQGQRGNTQPRAAYERAD